MNVVGHRRTSQRTGCPMPSYKEVLCYSRCAAIFLVVAVAVPFVAVIVVAIVFVFVVGHVAAPSLLRVGRPHRNFPSSSWGFGHRYRYTRTLLHVVIAVVSVHPYVLLPVGIVIMCGHPHQLAGATAMSFCQRHVLLPTSS